MIYIWDNGEGHSDHELWFIASDVPRGVLESVFKLYAAGVREDGTYFGAASRLVGVAESVSWREPGATKSLEEWLSYRLVCFGEQGGCGDDMSQECSRCARSHTQARWLLRSNGVKV